MIEAFKIVTEKYDLSVCPVLPRSEYVVTRGYSFKLQTERAKYDLSKFSLNSGIVSTWNSLPEHIVSAESINSFKNKLDKTRRMSMSIIIMNVR